MKKCKNCSGEITTLSLVEGFCSTKCFWEYSDGIEVKDDQVLTASAAIITHFKIIKKKIRKSGKFFIHNKTLKPYLSLKMFDTFLLKNDLMVTNLDDELSVIKKSII